MWRVLSHEFRVGLQYRPFSNYIVAGVTQCTGCLCISLLERFQPFLSRRSENAVAGESVFLEYTDSPRKDQKPHPSGNSMPLSKLHA